MDNAQLIFERLITNRYPEIQDMIGNQEENLFIDFKEKTQAYESGIHKEDKKIFVKALSGFSNSSGGIIVWGIEARKLDKSSPDIACSEKPIKYLKRFQTDLNNLISDAIIPINSKVRNEIIYVDNNPDNDEGFIVTYIPESDLPPHRALLGDNHYYTRAGDSFIKMEHHMLADIFGRRQRPKLEITCGLVEDAKVGSGTRFHIAVGIKNVGKYIATYPAIRLKTGKDLNIWFSGTKGICSYNLNPVNQLMGNNYNKGFMFSGGISDIIHPYTSIDVTNLYPNADWLQKEELMSKDDRGLNLSFEFEIFAEGCVPETGKVEFSVDEIMDFLRI